MTSYVSGWDGLNLAGLDASNNVVVYWWAPGIEDINGGDPGKWLTQNMTSDLGGPTVTGQLDAYVTPWGGLNVAGTTSDGSVFTYWWAPGQNAWQYTNITATAGGVPLTSGIEVGVSAFDGGINIAGVSSDGHLHMMRWKPGDIWRHTDATALTGGALAAFPMTSSANGNRLLLATAGQPSSRNVVLFNFFLDTLAWTTQASGLVLAP